MSTCVLLGLLVACASPAKQPEPPKNVEKPDALCANAEHLTLPDGKLRCAELPFTVDFAPNTTLDRTNYERISIFVAKQERGLLAIMIEPRFSVAGEDTAVGMKARISQFVKEVVKGAEVVDAEAPRQPMASLGTAIAFTTPTGGKGAAYAYIANDWFVSIFAGGGDADNPSRPDAALGKPFLASLKLRALPKQWSTRDFDHGVKLEMPMSSWERPIPEGERLFSAPSERIWIGVGQGAMSPKCSAFDGVTDVDVPGIVHKLYNRTDLQVTGRIAHIATAAVFAQFELPESERAGTMVMYLICDDPNVVLVDVTGHRPTEELVQLLDRVTSTFKH